MASTRNAALITGGASGMGYGMVKRLVQLGWNVSIVDLDERMGKEAEKALGEQTMFVQGDVANYDSLASAFVQTWDKWGRLDLVWSNAGIGDRMDFTGVAVEGAGRTPPKPDVAVVDICLNGCIYAAYLALHFFRKNQSAAGKLVMTSSMAGLYGSPLLPLYASAKHGVVGLTRSLAGDLALRQEPITVNCICPGLVPTPLAKALSDHFPEDKLTPISTIVKSVEAFINDDSLNGQVVECSGQKLYHIPVKAFADEEAEYLVSGKFSQGTGIDPYALKTDSIRKGKAVIASSN